MKLQKSRFFQGKANDGRKLFEGNGADNTMLGSDDHDHMIGQKGNDLIKANKGDDVLLGGLGDDTLHGGAGNDLLIGGMGHDSLNGGVGADTFFISYGERTIVDFAFSEGDRLLFGVFLTNINYKQDGDNVLVKSDQGITTILSQDVNDFFLYGHP